MPGDSDWWGCRECGRNFQVDPDSDFPATVMVHGVPVDRESYECFREEADRPVEHGGNRPNGRRRRRNTPAPRLRAEQEPFIGRSDQIEISQRLEQRSEMIRWRVTPGAKALLTAQARARAVPVSALLEQAVMVWIELECPEVSSVWQQAQA